MRTARDLRALPKAHLHLHLEGSMRRSTLDALARRRGVDTDGLFRFRDLPSLVAAYDEVTHLVETLDDLRRICRELVEDEAEDGVRYTEPAVLPHTYAPRLGSPAEVFDAMHEAFDAAATATGLHVGLMIPVLRTHTPMEAEALARFAAERADDGVRSLGLAGDEHRGDLAEVRRAFETARAAGLRVVPHAGETRGAAAVREALDVLRPDRIAHGVGSVESPDVVARLAAEGVVCDVCPSSNVRLGVAPSLERHQLTAMLAGGVPVTLNADDSLFFGVGALDEYENARRRLHLDDGDLARIALDGIAASGMPARVRRALAAQVEAWLVGTDPLDRDEAGDGRRRPSMRSDE